MSHEAVALELVRKYAGSMAWQEVDEMLREDGEETLEQTIRALAAALSVAQDALRAEIERVCECGGEDHGEGIGVGAIDSERSRFDYGADAYNGAGDVITDYYDCPCVPLRAALVPAETETP